MLPYMTLHQNHSPTCLTDSNPCFYLYMCFTFLFLFGNTSYSITLTRSRTLLPYAFKKKQLKPISIARNILSVRVDKKDGRSSRGSLYRPHHVEERMEELEGVEEEVEEEEEEEEEVHAVPQDYDVEEDPDNIVIRPPPSDDEDM